MSTSMPHEDGIDNTLNLMREGYLYILNRRRSFNSDVFETRLLSKKAICMGGKEAAEIFYDPEKFKREGSAPNRLIQTLIGKNSVLTLDGDHHKHRKEMFMSLMSPNHLKRLTDIAVEEWKKSAEKWEHMKRVILYDEVQEMLCKIACQWAGVPVPENEVKNLTHDLRAMFESPAAVGPNHWKGRNARNRVETWIAELIEGVREGRVTPPENTALHRFVWYRNLDGNLLDKKTAAVEVINILRPIVAISIFINFTSLALHQYPAEREKLKSGEEKYAQMFLQEVRRYYPFFPFVAALVRKEFIWNNYTFEEGTLTLLDLYGTNHDPKLWNNPDVFDPKRFSDWEGSPFGFIPQGGGDYLMGHRCAGEWVTIEILKVSLEFLVNKIQYEVPEQDLSYSMVRIPSIPHSKIILKNIKQVD